MAHISLDIDRPEREKEPDKMGVDKDTLEAPVDFVVPTLVVAMLSLMTMRVVNSWVILQPGLLSERTEGQDDVHVVTGPWWLFPWPSTWPHRRAGTPHTLPDHPQPC